VRWQVNNKLTEGEKLICLLMYEDGLIRLGFIKKAISYGTEQM
jgi:hypothetical protein